MSKDKRKWELKGKIHTESSTTKDKMDAWEPGSEYQGKTEKLFFQSERGKQFHAKTKTPPSGGRYRRIK
jgi:hypothetical protein